MTILELLVLLIVAAAVGALGQALAGYSRAGCLVTTALGFVGALFGSFMAGVLGLPEIILLRIGSQPFPFVWAVVGATLFVALVGFMRRRDRTRRPL